MDFDNEKLNLINIHLESVYEIKGSNGLDLFLDIIKENQGILELDSDEFLQKLTEISNNINSYEEDYSFVEGSIAPPEGSPDSKLTTIKSAESVIKGYLLNKETFQVSI